MNRNFLAIFLAGSATFCANLNANQNEAYYNQFDSKSNESTTATYYSEVFPSKMRANSNPDPECWQDCEPKNGTINCGGRFVPRVNRCICYLPIPHWGPNPWSTVPESWSCP